MALGVAWGVFAVLVVLTFVFSYFVVRHYQDKHEAERLPTVISVIGLSVTLLCLVLIPVDIYTVSITRDHATGMSLMSAAEVVSIQQVVTTFYYIFYGIILAFIGFAIPFSYFYYEEEDEDATTKQRIFGALKYTTFFIIILVIILIIGAFLKPNAPETIHNMGDWAQELLDTAHGGTAMISFAVACLMTVGYLCWVTYTAVGMSSLPVKMIRGKLNPMAEKEDVSADLAVTREKSRAIESRYALTGRRMSRKDRRTLDSLKRQERLLSGRNERINVTESGWQKVVNCCRPFILAIGAFLLLVTLFLVTSIIMSNIDKAARSFGSAAGFVLKAPSVNPYDLMMTGLSTVFPLDYIIQLSTMTYLFFCTLAGIGAIGIRFLWVHMYKVKRGSTVPQGVLMTTAIMMLIVLALNAEMLTIAPQYVTFGSQTYIANATDPCRDSQKTAGLCPCSVEAPKGTCHMTVVATFVSRALISMPFFGVAFFAANWLWILVFIVALIVSLFRKKQSNVALDSDDSDDDNFA